MPGPHRESEETEMRRALAFMAALALVQTLAAPAAAKGQPEIVRLEPSVLDADFLAGTCDFPVELVDQSTNSKLMFFPVEDDGSQLMRSTGGYRSTVTNLDTDESIELSYYSKIDFDIQSDGSQIIHATGAVFTWVFEGDDLSVFDPGLYLITGRTRSFIGPDGFALAPEQIKGNVLDVCAALS
jgi:hypothetical protein